MSEISLLLFNDTSGTRRNQTEMTFTMMLTLSLPSQIVSILGLAGNGFVIWFLCFAIQRNPFAVYILNLAAADFLLLLCVAAALLYVLINPRSLHLRSNIDFLFFIQVFFTSGYNASLLILMVISVERCISVLHPLWYKCHRPTHLSTVVCVFTWTFAILIMLIECVMCYWEAPPHVTSQCTAVIVFLLFWSFGIISPIMIISSLLLMITVKRTSKRHQPVRLYRVILLNILVFLVTTLVPKLFEVLFYFQIINFHLLTFLYVPVFFICLNSSANPYIYFLVGRTKKKKTLGSIKGALHRVFQCDNESSCQNKALNTTVTMTGDCELSDFGIPSDI